VVKRKKKSRLQCVKQQKRCVEDPTPTPWCLLQFISAAASLRLFFTIFTVKNIRHPKREEANMDLSEEFLREWIMKWERVEQRWGLVS
jgi:hypothetical protein